MHNNAVSYRTKQQNLLRSKTKAFLKNYSQCFQRVKSRSSMHNLAGTVYSSKQNLEMSPKKTASKSVIFPVIGFENPEIVQSSAIKGLNMRASHIPNYSDINTELILEKKRLEEKISFLKDQIVKEKKIYNRADLNSKKVNNELEKSNNTIKELRVKSERLNDGISEARQDCIELKMNLNNLKNEIVNTNTAINNEKANCNYLENNCKLLKNNLLAQEKVKNNLKTELIKEQKVMTSCSIHNKELEHERAILLLEINHSVALNKLQ